MFGSPRSGTTLAYQVLAQAFRVTYLPRALDFASGFTHTCFRLFSHKLREGPVSLRSVRGRTPGLFGPSEAIGFWTPWVEERGPRADRWARQEAGLALAVHRLQGHLESPLLVKCVYLAQAVNLLARAFPDARFVHLERAPVPAIASLYRIRSQTAPAWWSVRPPGIDRVAGLPLLDQCIWQHFAVDAMVGEALSALGAERSRKLVYEDLCQDPGNEVDRLCRWLTPLGWKVRKDWDVPSLVPSDRVNPELEKRIRGSGEFRYA